MLHKYLTVMTWILFVRLQSIRQSRKSVTQSEPEPADGLWTVVCYTYLHTPSDWSAWPQFSARGREDLNRCLMYTSGPTGPEDRHTYQISFFCLSEERRNITCWWKAAGVQGWQRSDWAQNFDSCGCGGAVCLFLFSSVSKSFPVPQKFGAKTL